MFWRLSVACDSCLQWDAEVVNDYLVSKRLMHGLLELPVPHRMFPHRSDFDGNFRFLCSCFFHLPMYHKNANSKLFLLIFFDFFWRNVRTFACGMWFIPCVGCWSCQGLSCFIVLECMISNRQYYLACIHTEPTLMETFGFFVLVFLRSRV